MAWSTCFKYMGWKKAEMEAEVVWKWSANGETNPGWWFCREDARRAAESQTKAGSGFRIYQDILPRKKAQHRIVSPWVEGRPMMSDAMQYRGYHCEVEYREVDA